MLNITLLVQERNVTNYNSAGKLLQSNNKHCVNMEVAAVDAEYHDCDFDWNEFANSIDVEALLLSANNHTLTENPHLDDELNKQATSWDSFYSHHRTAEVYKPRRYLHKEFQSILIDSRINCILEVGSGYGSSCVPLLQTFPEKRYVATDFSPVVVDMLSSSNHIIAAASTPDQVKSFVWDITQEPSVEIVQEQARAILCVFCLSAVSSEYHLACLQHMAMALDSSYDGYILFRDYGLLDMTMFRHKQRVDELTFRRPDGTLCYYFSLPYLQQLAEIAGLIVVDLKYATVINGNRRTGQELRRVFVHAIFKKRNATTPITNDVKEAVDSLIT